MSIDYISIGKKIREERMLRNLTLEQLAEVLELSPSYMGLIERGQRGISIDTLYKVCMTFKISSDYLIGIENDTAQSGEYHILLDKIIAYTKDYSEEELKFLIEFIELKNRHYN